MVSHLVRGFASALAGQTREQPIILNLMARSYFHEAKVEGGREGSREVAFGCIPQVLVITWLGVFYAWKRP